MWVAIDFGTCTTGAAYIENGRLVHLQEPVLQQETFPSAVYVTSEGQLLVGYEAINQRAIDPASFQDQFKRNLGESTPFFLGGREFMPEQLVGELLRYVRLRAESILSDRSITGVVLTVPASYEASQKKLMEQAAIVAGFNHVAILSEPVAAAMAHDRDGGWRTEGHALVDGDVFLVYDLGGGTFDAALMRKTAGGYEELAPAVGLSNCGGSTFDRAIFADVLSKHPGVSELIENGDRSLEALRTRAILGDECRRLKHELSSEQTAALIVPGRGNEYRLRRQEFSVEIVGPELERTWPLCRRLIERSGLEWDAVSAILLVGGSCRIPAIAGRVREEFGRPTIQPKEPELMICAGAAWNAHELNAKEEASRVEAARHLVSTASSYQPSHMHANNEKMSFGRLLKDMWKYMTSDEFRWH